jgi:hypothetical protein
VLSPDKPAKPVGPRLVKENFLRNAAQDPKKHQIFTRPFKMWWEDDKHWWNAQFMSLSFDPAAECCALILYQDGSEESLEEADLLEIVNKGGLGHGDPGQPMLQVVENDGGDGVDDADDGVDAADDDGALAVTLVPIAAPPLPPKSKQNISSTVKEPAVKTEPAAPAAAPAAAAATVGPVRKLPAQKVNRETAAKNKRSSMEMQETGVGLCEGETTKKKKKKNKKQG